MKLYLSESDVLACLPMSKAIELLDGAFRMLAAGTAVAPHGALSKVSGPPESGRRPGIRGFLGCRPPQNNAPLQPTDPFDLFRHTISVQNRPHDLRLCPSLGSQPEH